MIKNYYWAMAIMAAFVAGTIATATPVFAPPPEDDGEGGWKLAVKDLQGQIDTVNVDDADRDPTNELGPVLGHYVVLNTKTADAGDAISDSVVVNAICDDGDKVTGGGYEVDSHLTVKTNHITSFDPLQWRVVAVGDVQEGDLVSGAVHCADFAPLHNP